MRDLMERLAAADPQRDAERQPDEALLARLLATPLGEPRPRRWRLVAAGAAAAAAVALAAILAGSPGTGVVDKAVAAATREESVYHVVQLRRGTGNIAGASSGPFRVETWRSSDGRLHEKVFTPSGRRLLEETAGWRPPDRNAGPTLTYDPAEDRIHGGGIGRDPEAERLPVIDPYGDPGAGLRVLQERGLLEEDGETRVGNRPAYRLVGEAGEQRFEYVVDAETYLPLTQRWTLRRGPEELGFVSEFLVYERLPVDARSLAQLDLDPHPGATCAHGADDATERALGFPNPCRTP